MADTKDVWYDRCVFIVSEIVFKSQKFILNYLQTTCLLFDLKYSNKKVLGIIKNLAAIGKILIIIVAE